MRRRRGPPEARPEGEDEDNRMSIFMHTHSWKEELVIVPSKHDRAISGRNIGDLFARFGIGPVHRALADAWK